MKISLCMIVKNEEDTIARCIESASELVDEIVIVDTGSTDNTIKVLKELDDSRVRIESIEWTNDFSVARNKSIELASNQWILMLDADETLRMKSKEEFISYVEKSKKDAYIIGIYNHIGKNNIAYTNVMFRLFNKNGIRFSGAIHEKLLKNGHEIANYGTIPDNLSNIEHFGYSAEVVSKKKKAKRNIEICLSEVNKNPNNSFNWYNLGASYLLDNNYQEALKCFSEVEKLNSKLDQSYLIDMFIKKSDCLVKLGESKKLLGYLADLSSVDIVKKYPDYYYFLGKAYEYEKLYTEALSFFELATKFNNDELSYSIKGINSYISLIEIGRMKMELGQTEDGIKNILEGIFHRDNTNLLGLDDIKDFLIRKQAFELLEKIEKMEKNQNENNRHNIVEPPNYKGLIMKSIEQGDIDKAKELINGIDLKYKDIEVYNFEAIILMMENRFDDAKAILEKAYSHNEPNIDIIYNLAYVYSMLGDKDRARSLYNEGLKIADEEAANDIRRALEEL